MSFSLTLSRQLLRPAASSSRLVVANSSRIAYSRNYSSNHDQHYHSSQSNARPAPYAFGLLGLGSAGGLAAWFGGDKPKDPETTQDGMSKKGGTVDYQQVYNAIAQRKLVPLLSRSR